MLKIDTHVLFSILFLIPLFIVGALTELPHPFVALSLSQLSPTMAHNPNEAIDGESPGRAAATIQFFEYVSYYISSHTAANGMFVYPVSRNSRPDQHTRGIGCPSSPQRSPSSTLCHTKFGLWGT
jgi:hypothetical protein